MTENQKLYGTALVKAKEILDFMLTTATAPNLREISEGVGIGKPTTLKILTTMVAIGLLRRVGEDKRYYLGIDLIAYADKASNDFSILTYARDPLTRLRDATDETINLGIEDNHQIILLDKMESKHRSIRLKSQVGGKMNMYSSSMGKAVLSTWTPQQLERYAFETEMQKVGPNTITTPNQLIDEIHLVQERGYSTDNEENEADVYCLGFPLVKDGKNLGAFSITAPKYRMSEKNRKKYIELATQTQQEIEKTL